MNREIYKKDDRALYKNAKYNLHKCIRDAKRGFQNKLEAQFNQVAASWLVEPEYRL